MLEGRRNLQKDYDKWRYHYPELNRIQNYVKTPWDLRLTLSLVRAMGEGVYSTGQYEKES